MTARAPEDRIDLRLDRAHARKLSALARARTTNGSKPDALRMLIREAFEALTPLDPPRAAPKEGTS